MIETNLIEDVMINHNDAIEALQDLGKKLMEAYPDTIEDSTVEKAYLEVFRILGAVSIGLCCLGNMGRADTPYGTNDAWYVTKGNGGGL